MPQTKTIGFMIPAIAAAIALNPAWSLAAGGADTRSISLAELKAQAAAELPRVVPVGFVKAAAPDQDYRLSDKDIARFKFLKMRLLEKRGLPPEAGETSDESKWGPRPAPWIELEAQRAERFDKRFGRGTYDAVIRFSSECRREDGCELLATVDLISGAYRFIDLEKDVERGTVVRGSEVYRSRDEGLKTEMRDAIEQFRPKTDARKEYKEAFAAFADPILMVIQSSN